jgi:hypothetical protein
MVGEVQPGTLMGAKEVGAGKSGLLRSVSASLSGNRIGASEEIGMVYSLYQKSVAASTATYRFVEPASLFGCNESYIPWLLSLQIPSAQGEPFQWHVDIESLLAQRDDVKGNTLVIDLKPKNTSSISLYEVAEAWGYSDSGWTPIMLHLRGLLIEHDRDSVSEGKLFDLQPDEIHDPIFSMMYLRGTVADGKIVGTWTTPRPSATNSVLLWPESFEYFITEAQKVLEGS